MAGVKLLQKRGFILKEDSQYYIFERRELDAVLFDQIKIKKETMTFKCSTYIFTKEDGYKEEGMTMDLDIISAILVFLKDVKKGEK